MIEFVVEDGTGLETATSYVEIAEFKQYFENKGKSFTEADAVIQAWLNDASNYADCNNQWSGVVASEDQGLEIPRTLWYNNRGFDLSETVPTALKNGVSELAYARAGGSATASVYDGDVKRKSIGPLTVELRSSSEITGKASYPAADDWFSKLGRNDKLGKVCRT
jgi:hypothetical protein